MNRIAPLSRIIAAALVASAVGLAPPAAAQGWPAGKPVRIIVPYTPGGGIDTVVGAEIVAKAPPDGYTLMASSTEFAINPAIGRKLPYDPLRDFAPISQLANVSFFLVCHPSVPVRTVKDLIALARARPGQVTYGSSGTGGGPHLAGELLQSMARIKWTHIPYKGAAPASIAVMSGEIDFSFGATIGLLGHVRAGRLRAVAVTGTQRFAETPQVPTVAESGVPGYSAIGWYGFYAPGGASPDLVRRLHGDATRALGAPEIRERLAKAGNDYVMSTPEEFAAFIRAEIAKWSKVVKEAGLKPD